MIRIPIYDEKGELKMTVAKSNHPRMGGYSKEEIKSNNDKIFREEYTANLRNAYKKGRLEQSLEYLSLLFLNTLRKSPLLFHHFLFVYRIFGSPYLNKMGSKGANLNSFESFSL
jgi:hypothetical protein